jgi:hypothetical protein
MKSISISPKDTTRFVDTAAAPSLRAAGVGSGGRRERRAEVGGGGREGESWLAPWEVAGGEGTALCRRSGRDLRRSLRERREGTDLR